MSLGGNSLLHVLFIMEYQFCVGTSFAMDKFGKLNFHTNMSPTMFITNLKELCNFTWNRQFMIIFVQWTHSITLHRFHDEL